MTTPEQWERLAKDELHRRADAETLAMLEGRCDEWYRALVRILQDVDAQFTSRKADLHTTQRECWQEGQQGRERWLDAAGEYERWKTNAATFKRSLLAKIREVKGKRSAQAQEVQSRGRYKGRLRKALVAIELLSAQSEGCTFCLTVRGLAKTALESTDDGDD